MKIGISGERVIARLSGPVIAQPKDYTSATHYKLVIKGRVLVIRGDGLTVEK
jgi:hypothetical protein